MTLYVPHFHLGLPAFLQGFLLVVLLCVIGLAAVRFLSFFADEDSQDDKPSGATPVETPKPVETTPEPASTQKQNANPSLSDDELAIYDIPTILRRRSDFTHRKPVRDLMKPVTKGLFEDSANALAAKRQRQGEALVQFQCDVSDYLQGDLSRSLGQEAVTATGFFYNRK
ncbi:MULTISPECIES: hypothetical protein [Halomonas]|uniref:hypothetical protein n=1 Tax=Halomonas TaxID=2745 RepID=UPI0018683E7A|nr:MULTISPECIES: hypothetical protein [Halomonas]